MGRTGVWQGAISELDGLRGIAILLVMLHHFWPQSGPMAQWHSAGHLGWIGVDLFFVISGFLICGILLDTRGEQNYYLNFYSRRSLRIFPLYYLFLIAVFILVPLAQTGSYFQTEFLRQSGSPLWYFCYAGNWREAIAGHEPAYYLAPLWSLSIEEQFYITFPLAVALLGPKHLGKLLWFFILFAPVFRTVTFFVFPANERIQYLATFSRMDVISMGCLLALSFRSGTWHPSPRKASIGMTILLAALVVAFNLGGLDRTQPFGRIAGYSLVAATFFSVVLWALLHRGDAATAFLRFGPLRYVGKICYGVYLLQRPAETIVLKLLPCLHIQLQDGGALMLLKMAFALAIASLSWYLFEQHVLRLKRYFVSRRHPSERVAPEAAPAR
jgi:peptidoglycan/LPS O-acetylase OafA/YrhL